jgi:hypothetical protein
MSLKTLILGKHQDKLEKAHSFITLIIRITIIIAIITAIFNSRWTVLFISSLTFILTFLPRLIEKRYKLDIPIEFEIVIVLFIYASIFLGEVHGFYSKFWWWDAVLHTGSGVALGFIGFAILLVLYRGGKIKASPFTLVLFAFSFAVALGALWEIFEFAMDSFFNTNMQKNGLVDTMWDLIVDSLGAVFASIIGYLYIKTGQVLIFDKIINKFVKDNPILFN